MGEAYGELLLWLVEMESDTLFTRLKSLDYEVSTARRYGPWSAVFANRRKQQITGEAIATLKPTKTVTSRYGGIRFVPQNRNSDEESSMAVGTRSELRNFTLKGKLVMNVNRIAATAMSGGGTGRTGQIARNRCV